MLRILRRRSTRLLAVVCVLFLAACGGANESATESDVAAAAQLDDLTEDSSSLSEPVGDQPSPPPVDLLERPLSEVPRAQIAPGEDDSEVGGAFAAPPAPSFTPDMADQFQTETVPQAPGAFSQPGGQITVESFLDSVIQHADQRVWVPYFAAMGLAEPMVDVIYVGSATYPSFVSQCDLDGDRIAGDFVTADSLNAWYCSRDGGTWGGALILPVNTFSRMWNGQVLSGVSSYPGDFAAAVVAAHEFGHHVANEMALQIGVPEETGTKNPELFADCLAGIWTAGAYHDNILEEGDYYEGVRAMIAIGVNGSPTHGSAQEREAAFLDGYNSGGLPYNCMIRYWPTMARYLEQLAV